MPAHSLPYHQGQWRFLMSPFSGPWNCGAGGSSHAEEMETGVGWRWLLAQSGPEAPRCLIWAPAIAAHLFSEGVLALILCCYPFWFSKVGVQTFLKGSRPSFPLHRVLLCQSVLDTNRIKTRQKGLMPGNGRRLAITLVRYLGRGG